MLFVWAPESSLLKRSLNSFVPVRVLLFTVDLEQQCSSTGGWKLNLWVQEKNPTEKIAVNQPLKRGPLKTISTAVILP